jgi:hypothetical protein
VLVCPNIVVFELVDWDGVGGQRVVVVVESEVIAVMSSPLSDAE